MIRRRILLLAAAGALLGGCSLAPEYTRPEAPVPGAWPAGTAYDNAQSPPGAKAAAEASWKEVFPDRRLRKVIEMALGNNRSLRVAALNVEYARALYGVQRSELFPTVNATAAGAKQRVPADLSRSGQVTRPEEYNVNLGIAAWEIDFFGRIRSLKDAALEEYLATEQARRSARILLVSEVANAWFSLAADRETLRLARSTMETQQAAYDLVRKRYDVGLLPELDLRQAQTRVDAARADAALYERRVAQDRNALDLLAGGRVPDDLLPDDLGTVVPPEEVAAGLPSDVLLRRPDILQAESLLRAENANIGAARATLFPRISLTASFGTSSAELSNLFKSGQESWNFAPRVVLPIFDARSWAALDAVKVRREIAVAQYEKAIQSAFREVADALAAKGTIEEQLAAQQSLVEAVEAAYRLSGRRYEKGIDSYLGVLDAQRSLYAAQQGLISARLARLAARVNLYAVLGGGGDDDAPPAGRR
jgi:multidrug efflux system outer membrane protein